MIWFGKRKCPHYSPSQKGCRIAGALCKDIPAPVSEDECARCAMLAEPTMDHPNEVVALVSDRWKGRRQVRARAPETPAYTEADFPCDFRGEESGEHQCTECDGGKLHVLYDCVKRGGECTVLAAPKARGKDGQRALCCMACDQRAVNGTLAAVEVGRLEDADGPQVDRPDAAGQADHEIPVLN